MQHQLIRMQYGGSPVKVGDEEYHLFRDHEYAPQLTRYSLSDVSIQTTCEDQRVIVGSIAACQFRFDLECTLCTTNLFRTICDADTVLQTSYNVPPSQHKRAWSDLA